MKLYMGGVYKNIVLCGNQQGRGVRLYSEMDEVVVRSVDMEKKERDRPSQVMSVGSEDY